MQAGGLNYPAIICRNMEESVGFYRRLGMTALYTEPNRDDAESIQTLMHAGGDTFLLLVGPIGEDVKIAEASLGVGSMQYLSLTLSAAEMDQIHVELSNAGVHGSEEIHRGYERLVFMEDPNGVLVTLTAWTTEPPASLPRAAVLAQAAALRTAEGSPYIEDTHLRQAIEALGS